MCGKKFRSGNFVGSSKFLGPEKVLVQKLWYLTTFGFNFFFGLGKILGPILFFVKIFSWVQKVLSQIFFISIWGGAKDN